MPTIPQPHSPPTQPKQLSTPEETFLPKLVPQDSRATLELSQTEDEDDEDEEEKFKKVFKHVQTLWCFAVWLYLLLLFIMHELH